MSSDRSGPYVLRSPPWLMLFHLVYWPIAGTWIVLLVLGSILAKQGGPVGIALSVPVLLVELFGVWRVARYRLVLDGNSLVICNPIRDYRIDLSGETLKFYIAIVSDGSGTGRGIAVERASGERILVFATGYISKRKRAELAEILRELPDRWKNISVDIPGRYVLRGE